MDDIEIKRLRAIERRLKKIEDNVKIIRVSVFFGTRVTVQQGLAAAGLAAMAIAFAIGWERPLNLPSDIIPISLLIFGFAVFTYTTFKRISVPMSLVQAIEKR